MKCTKTAASKTQDGMSLAACKLTCYTNSESAAVLWPKPTTKPVLSSKLVSFGSVHVKVTYELSNKKKVTWLHIYWILKFTSLLF